MTLYTIIDSPIDPLMLSSDGEGITGLYMGGHQRGPTPDGWVRDDHHPVLLEARRQLDAYFAGELCEFDLPLNPVGSEFQQSVWKALREIPYGSTTSYGELARRIGNPNASRAVGLANGRNPISIVVPCHRVVGANGALVGFGGGLDRKRKLLDLEAQVASRGDAWFRS